MDIHTMEALLSKHPDFAKNSGGKYTHSKFYGPYSLNGVAYYLVACILYWKCGVKKDWQSVVKEMGYDKG